MPEGTPSPIQAIMKKTTLLLFLGVATGAAASLQAASSIGIGIRIGAPPPVIVHRAPPPRVVERVVVSPGPNYTWVAGHYTWAENQWVWVRGAWMVPPQPNALWVEGRWEPTSQQWIEGHWEIPAPPPPPPAPSGPPPQSYSPPPQPAPDYGYGGEIYVEQAPPPPRQDVIYARPSQQHVWISGYWSWRDGHHTWVAGRWDRPPAGRHTWEPPRWERRGRGHVFIEGHWR